MIDVIIPTIPGRKESLDRLISSLARTERRLNIVPVPNSETCGQGWKAGMEATEGDYLLLACDDQEFLDPAWADICVETVEQGYLPCPRVWSPSGSIESQGGDMNKLHHAITVATADKTPVDYTTIPFMSRTWAEAVGMIPELHYCSDVWVSYRARQLGIETVLRHGFDVRHYREDAGRGAGMTEHDRNAHDEKIMRKELERCESLSPAA